MRVSGEGHVTGRQSRAARGGRFHMDPETKGIGVNIPGAFAEYVRVPAFNIVPLPDDVDDEMGAILVLGAVVLLGLVGVLDEAAGGCERGSLGELGEVFVEEHAGDEFLA